LRGRWGVEGAWPAARWVAAAAPASLPRVEEIQLGPRAVAFALALSALAAPAFGAVPLLYGVPLASSLHDRGRANTASRSGRGARHTLMGATVALALTLLVASGLMVRSFQKVRGLDPGFGASQALTLRLWLPARDFGDR